MDQCARSQPTAWRIDVTRHYAHMEMQRRLPAGSSRVEKNSIQAEPAPHRGVDQNHLYDSNSVTTRRVCRNIETKVLDQYQELEDDQ